MRISPGQIVVTYTFSPSSSARSPSPSPTSANLAAEYGSRCGTAIFPPMLATLPTRPPPWRRKCGRAARVACRADQKMVRIATS